jgi:hypothetical protein
MQLAALGVVAAMGAALVLLHELDSFDLYSSSLSEHPNIQC